MSRAWIPHGNRHPSSSKIAHVVVVHCLCYIFIFHKPSSLPEINKSIAQRSKICLHAEALFLVRVYLHQQDCDGVLSSVSYPRGSSPPSISPQCHPLLLMHSCIPKINPIYSHDHCLHFQDNPKRSSQTFSRFLTKHCCLLCLPKKPFPAGLFCAYICVKEGKEMLLYTSEHTAFDSEPEMI